MKRLIIVSLIVMCLCSCQKGIKEDEYLVDLNDYHTSEAKTRMIIVRDFQMRELYIINERWQAINYAGFNHIDGKYPQEYVYVIGTSDMEELFTVRKSGTKVEWRK